MLLGAGHAHLYTLLRAARFIRRGHSVAVIGPRSFWYSGLATGMLGGHYSPDQDRLALPRLLDNSGAQFIEGTAESIDAKHRILRLADGGAMPYDVLSVNVGSTVRELPGSKFGVYGVKPIANLCRLHRDLEAAFAGRRDAVRVLIAGSGATGCEVAANVAALARRVGGAAAIEIVGAGERLVPQLSPAAALALAGALRSSGITVRLKRRVTRVADGIAHLDDGTTLPFDAMINATGLQPPTLLRDSGLLVDRRGGLLVDRCLRSLAEPNIFGGGDCIAIEGWPLPMIGVYAIREAPILCANLLAAAENRPLARFTPQRHYLWIMNLGDGTALAARHRWWCHGRAAFLLKDWLDRRFLAAYRR